MKLVLAIIQNDDSIIVTSALTECGFMVTRLSTTGGYLMVGNTTLLIGTEEDKIDLLRDTLKRYCSPKKQVNPTTQTFGRGLMSNGTPEEVISGGAVMFTLSVDSFDKI